MRNLPQPRGRAARRVHRTAKLLDRQCPSWYRRVNPDSLDLGNWNLCILGQTYGGPSLYLLPMGMWWRVTLGGHMHALNLFFLEPRGGNELFEALGAAWRYEIDVRRRTDRMRDALADVNVTDYAVTLVP